MAEDYRKEEARIEIALRHISTKTSYNLAEVARMYDVGYKKLQRRVAGRGSKSTRPPTNQQLNLAQLKALELYIHRLDLLGQPPLISIWRAAAEHIWSSTT